MNDYQDTNLTIDIAKPHVGFWQKLGGTSLTIALIVHIIALILGAIWIFQTITPPKEGHPFIPPGGERGKRGLDTTVNTRKPATNTQSNDIKRVIAVGAISNFIIPDTSDQFGQMSALTSLDSGGPSGMTDDGNGPGMGPKIGNGPGIGPGISNLKLFTMLPQSIRKRCSKDDRLARLRENGGTPACEDAVLNGLRWLKANQNPDGSWGPQKHAMTGLALLAYFGHCETPVSDEFGDSVLRAIVFLVDAGAKNNGMLSTNIKGQPAPYEHAIATYALGEAATFCKELNINVPSLMEVTEKAGQYIIDNQHENGGWAYGYGTTGAAHTDTSVVGWQLQALKACSHTSIKYKGMKSAVDKGLKYLVTCQAASGSFGYTGPDGRVGLTGVGVLCHQMWGEEKSKAARNGVKFIKENFKLDWNTPNSDLYSHYYASQAMMQAGGSYWKSYNDMFRDQLLNNQNPDGSWKAPVYKMHGASPVYINTLSILMLEVYYRFLNSTGGGIKERSGI